MSDKIGYVAHKHGRRDGEVVSEETRAAIDAGLCHSPSN